MKQFILVKIENCTNPGVININSIVSIMPKTGNEFKSIVTITGAPFDIVHADEPTSSIERKLQRAKLVQGEIKMKSDLSKCKVGDWIWTIQEGWAQVQLNSVSEEYAIRTPNNSYTLKGREMGTDEHPSAYLTNPFDPEDTPPCEFKKGQVIVVWDDSKDEGKYSKIFNRYEYNERCPYIGIDNDGWKYARALNSTELGEE